MAKRKIAPKRQTANEKMVCFVKDHEDGIHTLDSVEFGKLLDETPAAIRKTKMWGNLQELKNELKNKQNRETY